MIAIIVVTVVIMVMLSHLHRSRYDCELAPEHIADLAVGQNIHHLFEQVLDTF